MAQQGRRHLRDGREVPVHDNDGLRKICGCPRRTWARCNHAWHFAFCWKGKHYRFSLDRYTGKRVEGKTEAVRLAEHLRGQIRDGTFSLPVSVSGDSPSAPDAGELSFEAFGEVFVERYSKAREKASWDDDASMLRQVMAFPVRWPGASRLGEKPLAAVTEDDIEAFIRHVSATRTTATRNHYVQLLRTVSTWAVRRGYREKPLATTESDVIRRKKASKRNRRLEPGEEDKLLAAAGPHLQHLIVAALETCCRLGELLSLVWRDVSLGRSEIVLRAAKTKTATDRVIPISSRLRTMLELVNLDLNDEPLGPMAYVFGDELGGRVKCIRRAWQTAVLKAHGQTPVWAWKRNRAKKGTGKLAPESLEQFRTINLHFHDLRHEAGSRLLEAGWPLHEVQQMLGHASLEQTSTYLNATLRGMHRSMRAFDLVRAEAASDELKPGEPEAESGKPCKIVASEAPAALLAPCKGSETSGDKSLIH
jgi:integrase